MTENNWEHVISQLKARSRSTIHLTSDNSTDFCSMVDIPALSQHSENYFTKSMTNLNSINENSTNLPNNTKDSSKFGRRMTIQSNNSFSGAKTTNKQKSKSLIQKHNAPSGSRQLASGLDTDKLEKESCNQSEQLKELHLNKKQCYHSDPYLDRYLKVRFNRELGGSGFNVKFLTDFFETEYLKSKRSDNSMSRLARKISPPRSPDGEDLNSDKRRPFSRPFNKSRLDSVAATAAAEKSGRMSSSSPVRGETGVLLKQNNDLRQRLQDESSSYRRRLDTYKQAQHNQAALISRLQSKVLQYKQRCSELEGQIHETISTEPSCLDSTLKYDYKDNLHSMTPTTGVLGGAAIPMPSGTASGHYGSMAPQSLPCAGLLDYSTSPGTSGSRDFRAGDIDDLAKRFEEERRRCEHLVQQNNMLRKQLEESHCLNEAVTNDLQKITNDWEGLRDEMNIKEDEWKEEEQAFNEYYNNEHTRLLKMWREVVAMKRLFKEMQTSTKIDLNKIRTDISAANREVGGACNAVNVNLRHANRVEEAQQMHIDQENHELKSQVSNLRHQFEGCKTEIMQRDQRIQQLEQELKLLDERYSQADGQAQQTMRLNDEIERLNGALRDIGYAVLQDAESTADTEIALQHLHLTQGAIAPPRSPKRNHSRTSQALAEGTISAVQAALHKYQLLIHDLQVKLQANNDNLTMTKKQLDQCDHTREILSVKVSELTETLDASNHKLNDVFKERDSLQKTLDSVRNEKLTIERAKLELSSLYDNLTSDYEKLQNASGKLQKMYDVLDEDKKMLEMELQRTMKDKDIVELNLRAEEECISRLREETITLREETNKLYLANDMLEQQRIETDSLLNLYDKQKSELEYQLEKLKIEKYELQSSLDKKGSSNVELDAEINALRKEVAQLEEERSKLQSQTQDQSNDIASLKKELIAIEQSRLELDSEKLLLAEKLKIVEMEKEKIDQEIQHINREKADLCNQLTAMTKKKESIGEECMRLRQRLEQANEMNNRLNRSLEDLVKENEEKSVMIENNEKDLQRLQEQLASLRSEKESLEGVLFDTNTTLESTEIKKEQLEHDQQDLLVKQESLKNQILRLTKDLENSEKNAQEMKVQLKNAAANQEAEFLQKLANLKAFSEDSIRKLQEEKEQIRQGLEKKMQQSLMAQESGKDGEINVLKEQLEGLQMHLEALCLQHEEILIRAENDKQQSLLLAHRDKQAVLDKMENVRRELKAEGENLERLRREFSGKLEKDRITITSLREEIAKAKTKYEEARSRAEDDLGKLDLAITGLREERDTAIREVAECKMQIRLTEDKCDSLNLQLQENLRKLKESENFSDATRKELTDNKRALADSNIERDKYAVTNKELRDHVKRVEGKKREQSRSMDDAMQKITNLEETRNSLENEKIRLQTLLNETENTVKRISQELAAAQNENQKLLSSTSSKDVLEKELQARLNNESEERERIQQELHLTKKQLTDLEATLCATRQDLGRARCKANQDEHRWHTRETELGGRIEEGRGREKRLEDQKHNLEICLADATQQIQELKARLGGAEGRVRALDEQLANLEGIKREVENKLSSIGHTLRRIAGVQLDGSVTTPYRLSSPSRRYSPARGSTIHHHPDDRCISTAENTLIDVDPEMVRKGVRTLMQQVAQIERERDDFKAQLCTVKKQLQDTQEKQTKCENKITKLQQQLRQNQEERANLEAKLTQKASLLQSADENLKQKSNEILVMRDKISAMESALGSGVEEKGQCESRLEKCRQNGARLESEKRHLQEELARVENRASKLDLQRVGLDGDIQRLQMNMQEKDCTIQKLQERLENQTRNSGQLEDRCVALKTTVDQLKERVQAAAITETELRGEINGLHREKTDQGYSAALGVDKLKQLQKSLTTSENERRILAERMEAVQHSNNELRRDQQSNHDMNQRLQEQLADLEVQKSSLESQLRIAKWNQENTTTDAGTESPDESARPHLISFQRERTELRNKVDQLNEKIRHMENERRISKFSGHVQFVDRSEKSPFGDSGGDTDMDSNRMQEATSLSHGKHACGIDHSKIESESRELRMKLRRLETMLAEKEAELARVKTKFVESPKCGPGDPDRYRCAQLQAERLLDAREQSHRQQVLRLENQISMLRDQLAQEAKRRQAYILRSTRAGREVQQLRQTLGDSLRNVAHDPVDTLLLESEARRLDSAVSLSLPPTSGRDYDSLTPTYR